MLSRNDSPGLSRWDEQKLNIMRSVLKAKSDGCAEFRQRLIETGHCPIIEAGSSLYWARGLSIQMTKTLLYIIYITTDFILYVVLMTLHLLHYQMYFIMNHESESYCTVLATCILTLLIMSCAAMIIMPKGLISSTVDRDYNVIAHFRIRMSTIFVDLYYIS